MIDDSAEMGPQAPIGPKIPPDVVSRFNTFADHQEKTFDNKMNPGYEQHAFPDYLCIVSRQNPTKGREKINRDYFDLDRLGDLVPDSHTLLIVDGWDKEGRIFWVENKANKSGFLAAESGSFAVFSDRDGRGIRADYNNKGQLKSFEYRIDNPEDEIESRPLLDHLWLKIGNGDYDDISPDKIFKLGKVKVDHLGTSYDILYDKGFVVITRSVEGVKKDVVRFPYAKPSSAEVNQLFSKELLDDPYGADPKTDESWKRIDAFKAFGVSWEDVEPKIISPQN